jgi:O-antigen/teichoic acid export membrane protein
VLVKHLFEGQWLLLFSLLIGVVGYCMGHLARGVLSGRGQFQPYSLFIGAESTFRLAICILLAVAGVKTAGGYGLALGIAPVLAVLLIARKATPYIHEPGPPAPWSELSTSIGALLMGSVLAQGLANAGIIAAKVLANDDNKADAKRFFNGVLVARMPLFLFQAVQAALLPRLAALAGAHHFHDFRRQLRRLLEAVVAIGALGTVAGFVLGPLVLKILFDAKLGHRDLGLLAAGTAFFIVALSLAQALIAVEAPGRMAVGWFVGAVAFFAGLATSSDLHLRVEIASLLGSMAPVGVMIVGLDSRLRVVEAAEDREHLASLPAT